MYKLFFLFFPLSIFAQDTFEKKNIALSPPMGWNSWNTFRCDGLTEQLVKEIADIITSNGMKEAGYEYINIDDCWQVGRDENGKIMVDSLKFPSGMKSLIEYVHSKGLKFGIYSDAGIMTCQKRPGSFGYEEIDAKTYANWGVDYLKYDFCFLPQCIDQDKESKRAKRNIWLHFFGPRDYHSKEIYTPMAIALANQERDIVYSICNWGVEAPWTWAPELGHLWRTTPDIRPYFKGVNLKYLVFHSIMKIINTADENNLHLYAKPGNWNDPDMLEVGNGNLSYHENVAHFSMWAMMAAPLLAGNDLRTMNDTTLKILTNKKVIAINQDKEGKQGYKVDEINKVQVWIKPLSNHRLAVCFLNPNKEKSIEFDWQTLNLSRTFTAEDVWEGNCFSTKENLKVVVPTHGVKMYLLQ
jgi:alpha-galactosidase